MFCSFCGGVLAERFVEVERCRRSLVCGLECAEVRFAGEQDLPWTELAYPDIGSYLRRHFGERRAGERAVHFSRLDAATVVSKSYRISRVEESQRVRAEVNQAIFRR